MRKNQPKRINESDDFSFFFLLNVIACSHRKSLLRVSPATQPLSCLAQGNVRSLHARVLITQSQSQDRQARLQHGASFR
jgi:hypothetical protein